MTHPRLATLVIDDRDARALASTYLEAKHTVIEAGYAWELDWQEHVRLDDLTEPTFLREAAWVVLCSGMRESVVRSRFQRVSDAFLTWRSADAIIRNRSRIRRAALLAFDNPRKIDAILKIASRVAACPFHETRRSLMEHGQDFLRTLPFMGPATSAHLGKNLGLQVAKPDRHLVRIARMFGFQSVLELCDVICGIVYDPIPVVDLVLWRFAVLQPNYRSTLMTMYMGQD